MSMAFELGVRREQMQGLRTLYSNSRQQLGVELEEVSQDVGPTLGGVAA